MFATRLDDVANLVVALATLLASLTGAWVARKAYKEVKTMNGLSAAQLLDATETRRVDEIEVEDRTDAEQEHLDAEPRTESRP